MSQRRRGITPVKRRSLKLHAGWTLRVCPSRCSNCVAWRRPWQPRRRWPWGAVRQGPSARGGSGSSVPAAGSPASYRAARRPGEVHCAGPRRPPGPCAAGYSRGLVLAGCGGLPGCYFPRPRSILRHTGAGAAARQHLATSSRSFSQERKAPWKPRTDPLPPLPRRAGSRRWLSWRPSEAAVPAGTDASTAPPLPPTPCAGCVSRCGLRLGSFALPGRCSLRPHVTWRRTAAPSPFTWQVARHSPQCGRLRCKIQLPSARPHVYRAKLNTAALPGRGPVRSLQLAAGSTLPTTPGSAVSLDFCDDCKEPCLNSITVCGWVRC